ncbi:hypothetical protein PBCVNY2B_862R [Paramecium bursaria Chlorella virus NY2B]|uniref:Uncharacterized protein B839R n=2 Tax=Chlorovirus TaxID=181083 RepID=A7IY14_PBCVN|nr:hypothetical protein NY2A_B839R [Paramecium bursaria Chlorella virus NY2A]YP_001498834.1 hypothetical protein AR158_C753R [Paramecium bursaria Chlorella virus AR158]YP_009665562.1 hypothetical protein FK949_gp208 [Paramecium bursaria Chlorella virus NYs1]AGE54420.1 hypothetical protein PBCVIL52s1_885R [Paramecium bursaria Chlorella virus IL-5-2s1]AGE55100.1 hypothetical protein PBCVMA1D_860R [Paramecium bursaria Chlorella virus MA1D]AGE58539.1 hypothetical protein PBCVNY2B_862R [Paramecium 
MVRKLPYYTIVTHSLLGLLLGIVTGIANKHVNCTIHKRFPKDGKVVTGISLVAQFTIIIGVLILAATFIPFMDPQDLGAGVTAFAFTNLYMLSQTHFANEVSKFVEDKFDGLERYGDNVV